MTNLLNFFIFSAIAVFIYWVLFTPGHRSKFLLICSLLFIGSFSIPCLFYFLLNIVLVYAAGILIGKTKAGKRLPLTIILFWLIGSICFFKYLFKFQWNPWVKLPEILFPLGLSYITFRLIHYIVEVYKGNIQEGSLLDLALYVLFFPTFLAGPVERFQRFYPQTQSASSFNISEANYGLYRIICGLVRKIIIADNLKTIITPIIVSPHFYSRIFVICAIYGLAIQIYMDFAGYTDMAIGLSRLFGYRIMENFNRPFFQKNIALFWRNWHISVYSLIRDYFFFPLFGWRPSKVKIYIGIFCTMMVFTLWHKGNLNFFILGVYHGLGLVIWNIFQELKRKFPFISQCTSSRYLDPLAVLATFSFFSFGLIFFRNEFSESLGIIKRLLNL